MMGAATLAGMMDGDWGAGWTALVVVGMVAMMAGMGWMMWSMMRGGAHRRGDEPSPRQELAARYARGELTTDEYRERLRALEETGG